MPKFIKVFDCSKCPCRNCSRDDCDCNFGYEVELLWRIDEELIYCAINCELSSVSYENKVFKPVLVDATHLRPENW